MRSFISGRKGQRKAGFISRKIADSRRRKFLEACREGRVEEARAYEGDVNEVFQGEGSGLNAAAYSGHLALVKMLVEERGARVDLESEGNLPLHCAVHNDKPRVVRLLAELGADVEQADQHGTAMMHVHSIEMIPLLILELGAQPNLPHYALSRLQLPIFSAVSALKEWCKCAWEAGIEADLTRPFWREHRGVEKEGGWIDWLSLRTVNLPVLTRPPYPFCVDC